jgi:sigma-B regulation protein RsbU (phosphoserine phosphatase)
MMLAHSDALEGVARCLSMGAEDYVTEPLNATIVAARLATSLERQHLRQQVARDTLERERVADVLRESAKYERDVQIGRQIQAGFLPDTLPQPPGWEIAARFQPAREVAGDWYDAFPLSHNRVGLVIADVCDKGVGASMFMALMRSLIRAYSQQHYSMRWFDAIAAETPAARSTAAERRRALPSVGTTALKNAIELTNNYIAQTHGATGMFATVFFGVLDPATGRLMYVNAGHEAPIIIGPGGVRTRLNPTGMAVGMLADSEFGIEEIELEPGELLVAFTDGVPEARDPSRAFYSEERLLKLVVQPGLTATTALDRIVDSLQAHIAEADQYDDITLLSVRHVATS